MYQLPQISRLKSIVKCFSLTRISIDPQTSTYQRIRPTFPIRKPWIESGKRRRREKSIQILDHRITNEG